jgi:hypothetical protein
VITHVPTLRLNFTVFVLHAVLVAMWVAVPALLVDANLPKSQHWWVYLPAVIGSFVVMGMTLFPLERRGYLRGVFLSSVGLIAVVQLGLLGVASAHQAGAGSAAVCVLCGTMWKRQPSMASRIAPAAPAGATWVCTTACSRWDFYRRGVGRLARQGRWTPGPVWCLRSGHAGLAGRGLAYEGPQGRLNSPYSEILPERAPPARQTTTGPNPLGTPWHP